MNILLLFATYLFTGVLYTLWIWKESEAHTCLTFLTCVILWPVVMLANALERWWGPL